MSFATPGSGKHKIRSAESWPSLRELGKDGGELGHLSRCLLALRILGVWKQAPPLHDLNREIKIHHVIKMEEHSSESEVLAMAA